MLSSTAAILQSGNLYVYTINNPIMWNDPSGRVIVLAGNADQRRDTLAGLQSLTRDRLSQVSVDAGGGRSRWEVRYSAVEGTDRESGTQAIRRLVRTRRVHVVRSVRSARNLVANSNAWQNTGLPEFGNNVLDGIPATHYLQAAVGQDLQGNTLTPDQRMGALNTGIERSTDAVISGLMFGGTVGTKGTIGTKSSMLPNNARTFTGPDAPARAFPHLERYHGLSPHVASSRLHRIKKSANRGPADNIIIDRTGNVYDPVTRQWLGSLTQP